MQSTGVTPKFSRPYYFSRLIQWNESMLLSTDSDSLNSRSVNFIQRLKYGNVHCLRPFIRILLHVPRGQIFDKRMGRSPVRNHTFGFCIVNYGFDTLGATINSKEE